MDEPHLELNNQPIIPQAPIQMPEPIPPKHFGPKFIIALIIVLVVAGGAFGAIWWWGDRNSQVAVPSATPDPTEGWRTYTNIQYGFEFKYPTDWVAKTNFSGSLFSRSVVTILSPQALKDSAISSYQKNRVDFYVYNSINDLNNLYRLHATDLTGFLIENNNDVASFNRSTLNNLPAYDVNLGGEGTYFAIFLEDGGKIYEIFFNTITSRAEISTLENQILSTFKFIDQIDTSIWKTFSSKYFTLSFKIPSGFAIRDEQNIVSIALNEVESGEGFEGIFLQIVRYTDLDKAQTIAVYRSNHRDIKESSIMIDGQLYTRMDGINIGDGLLESEIFFDKSSVYIRQLFDKTFDYFVLGNQILSTFKFTK